MGQSQFRSFKDCTSRLKNRLRRLSLVTYPLSHVPEKWVFLFSHVPVKSRTRKTGIYLVTYPLSHLLEKRVRYGPAPTDKTSHEEDDENHLEYIKDNPILDEDEI